MRHNTLLLMALAGCLAGLPAFGQSGSKSEKSSVTKEETVVIRNGAAGKTVIEVKDGNIYVNGDVVATVKDAASGKVHKKIVVEGAGGDGEETFSYFGDGDDRPGRRAMLGVMTGPDESRKGAIVREVTPNSAAAKAGLQEGDRITKVDGERIGDARELVASIGRHQSGEKVSVTYERDGKAETVDATLTPANPESMARVFRFGPGDDMGDMPNAMMRRFNFPAGDEPFSPRPKLGITAEDRADGSGVRVLDVKPQSPAEKAGLKEGDVIRKVDGEAVGSVDELQLSLRDRKPNEPVKLEYQRNGKTATTSFTLPKPIRQREF